MTLGDLNDRVNELTATIQRQGQHLGALRDLVTGQEAAIAELLKRTAPRCEDTLEAVEARLAGCERTLAQPCPCGSVNYDSCPECRDWARRLRRDAALCWRCATPHAPERSPQGSPTDPSPSRDLAEHLAASPEAGNGDAPEGFCQCGRRLP